jgi:hypothetical protein
MMIFEMPYAAECINREVQNSLVLTLTEWLEMLNRQLADKNKLLVTLDHACDRIIEGSIEVSQSMHGAFFTNQIDGDNCLRTPIVINGIQIEFPMAFDTPATLSLLFASSSAAVRQGFAVNPLQTGDATHAPRSDDTASGRALKALTAKLALQENILSGTKPHRSDWTLYQPCFYPRLHREWLNRLLFALNTYSPYLTVRETGGGFLPTTEPSQSTKPSLADELAALADQYLLELAVDDRIA